MRQKSGISCQRSRQVLTSALFKASSALAREIVRINCYESIGRMAKSKKADCI